MKSMLCGRLEWGNWRLFAALLGAITAATCTAWAQAGTIKVNAGEAVTVPAEYVAKLAVADPTVADIVPLSDKELSVIGKKVGVTTLTVVHTEGRPTEMFRIEVGHEAAIAMIRQMGAEPAITVRMIGDTLVLDGQIGDELQAQRAVQVATAYREKVLNLLEIQKPRQIKVRTRVAEVNSDAVKRIGFKWFGEAGQIQYAVDYTGLGVGSAEMVKHGLVGFPPGGGGAGSIGSDVGADVILQLLQTKGYARLLSEPTLVTFSGKEASFLVGQEVPIVQQLQNTFTVEFKEVGVRMRIKPTADSQNRINTAIHAEVSQLTGRAITGGAAGTLLPVISSKKADTTLQVKDGQTIVIGGLLDNSITADNLRKLPWLADIPLFGFLFRHKEFQQAQNEVLFFMTPEIIKDIDADTAGAAKSPLMKEWNEKKSGEGVLELPKDHELLPEPTGYPWSKSAEEKPAAPAKEPKTNVTPARPASK
jgi:pilus assembly protein CpaC